MDLGNNERRMLRAMLSDTAREWTLGQILSETGWEDQSTLPEQGRNSKRRGCLN